MTDFPDFERRLEHALMQNGLTNAEFARLVHPDSGQQLVRSWKNRGKIGSQTERRVRQLLPLTNMDWLQTGEGSPEALISAAESSPSRDVRQSYAARPDVLILAKAVKLVAMDEALNGVYSFEDHAALLLEISARIEAGEDPEIIGMKLIHARAKGADSGKQSTGNGDRK